MRRTARAGLWVLALVVAAMGPSAGSETRGVVVVRRDKPPVSADLDGDGAPERIRFAPAQSPAVRVSTMGDKEVGVVPARWKPWKVVVADVEGDGKLEVVVGLRKATRYFNRPHNCLFLYRYRRNALEPLWLGSALSRPFEDFLFVPCAGRSGAALVALEQGADKNRSVAEYYWNGFGFTLRRRSGSWPRARLRPAGTGGVIVVAGKQCIRVPCCGRGTPETPGRKGP